VLAQQDAGGIGNSKQENPSTFAGSAGDSRSIWSQGESDWYDPIPVCIIRFRMVS
jgi:hypothetical protein